MLKCPWVRVQNELSLGVYVFLGLGCLRFRLLRSWAIRAQSAKGSTCFGKRVSKVQGGSL